MMKILFFGPVAERVGLREMQLDHRSGMVLQDVVAQLKAAYPAAFEIVCFTAVNETQTRDMQQLLNDGDEIVFMAKFSGG
ncbi:MAG: MoaD/ThiS family protein [Gallionella sp.]|jgi:molybdopterin synthase sulfur carrier subunit